MMVKPSLDDKVNASIPLEDSQAQVDLYSQKLMAFVHNTLVFKECTREMVPEYSYSETITTST